MTEAVLRVLFFASLRDATGVDEVNLPAPALGTLEALWPMLGERLGEEALAALRAENVRIAVNQHLVTAPVRFVAGDEIAFLPPVTGG